MNKRRAALIVCGLFALGAVLGGCGSGNHARDAGDAPTELFGTWRLVKITGGITGQGFPVPSPSPLLTFEQSGNVTQNGGGVPSVHKAYHVTRRKTLLNAEVVVPVVEYSDGTTPQIIEQVDDQNLVLADEANDGTGQIYVRETQSGDI